MYIQKPRHKILKDGDHPNRHEQNLLYRIRHLERTYRVFLTYHKPPHCLWDIRLLANLRELVTRSLNLFFINDFYLRFRDDTRIYLLEKMKKLLEIIENDPIEIRPKLSIDDKQLIGALNFASDTAIHNINYLGYNLDKLSEHFVVWTLNKAYYILSHIYSKFTEKQLKVITHHIRGIEKRLTSSI
ncbi:hypothetical protein LCGC14_0303560 [marine sediment metagenome]|uniref:Uncharacterized protein n=1 Tax=marine sediment metagenome TaxID=412755 RepID=A0A0F9TPU4_9ZZZZ